MYPRERSIQLSHEPPAKVEEAPPVAPEPVEPDRILRARLQCIDYVVWVLHGYIEDSLIRAILLHGANPSLAYAIADRCGTRGDRVAAAAIYQVLRERTGEYAFALSYFFQRHPMRDAPVPTRHPDAAALFSHLHGVIERTRQEQLLNPQRNMTALVTELRYQLLSVLRMDSIQAASPEGDNERARSTGVDAADVHGRDGGPDYGISAGTAERFDEWWPTREV